VFIIFFTTKNIEPALYIIFISPSQSTFFYIIFKRLDTERETIELVHTSPTETKELPSRIPTDAPRYHFFLYKHNHQGQALEAVG